MRNVLSISDDLDTARTVLFETASKVKLEAEKSLLKMVSVDQYVGEYEVIDYLIDGIIEEGRLYTLTAPTGTGKTAVALDMAEAVVMGKKYADIDTKQAEVLFIAGENPIDVRVRMMAIYERNPLLQGAGLHFIKGTFDIEAKMDELKAMLTANPKIKLVFVDTLQAFYTGTESNSNTEMASFAKLFRKISDMGIAVIVMAHPTKGATKDRNEPYGGGAFVNEIDGNLALWKDDSGAIEFYTCKKFRGSFETFKLFLERVEVKSAVNSKGEALQTVIARSLDEETEIKMFRAMKSDDTDIMSLLRDGTEYIRNNDIARALGWTRKNDGFADGAKVKRAINRLLELHYVEQNAHGIKITSIGKKWIGEEMGNKF